MIQFSPKLPKKLQHISKLIEWREKWFIKGNKFDNKIRRILRLKPIIPYIEIHLTDHCNLNCKGCGHFSTIADKLFMDKGEYAEDLQKLSRMISNIKIIRLMGGEPLLHPNVADFISITKAFFPNSNVHIVSNGILLPTMTQEFWESCRQNSVRIDLSIYPPFLSKESSWIELAESNRVIIKTVKTSNFFAIINSRGDSKVKKGPKQCRFPFVAMIRQGKLYNCWLPAMVHYFNQKYGATIPNAEYLDINDPKITGWDLVSKIENCSETCKYCTAGWKKMPIFQWAKSTHDRSDWDVAEVG